MPQIWWTNGIFFVSVHLAALFGVYYWPPYAVARANLVLSVVLWQLGNFGHVFSLVPFRSLKAYDFS